MEKTIEPYSVFLVWKDGKLTAAQHETKTIIRDDDGTMLSETVNPAVPIPIELSEEILGDINSAAIARIQELESDVASLTAELTELRELKSQMQTAVPAILSMDDPEAQAVAMKELGQSFVVAAKQSAEERDRAEKTATLEKLAAELGMELTAAKAEKK